MRFDDLPESIKEKIENKQHNIYSNYDLSAFGYKLRTRKTSKRSTEWIEIEHYKKLLESNRTSLKRKETQRRYSETHKEEKKGNNQKVERSE